MSKGTRVDWADVEPDSSSDQEAVPQELEEKHEAKEDRPKEPKKWHFLKVPKDKALREEIQQKRVQHKMQQLKIIDELEREIIWLYIFKNPNPELINFVESYPSIQTLSNQVGWDLKISKEQAKKLLIDGFGPTKVFGRMQVSRRNYEKQAPVQISKVSKQNKLEKKSSESTCTSKQSVFQKKKKPVYKQCDEKKEPKEQKEQKPKYRPKASLQINIPSCSDQIVNDEVKEEEQCRNGDCKQSLCQVCFEKTLISKTSSTQAENIDPQCTGLHMTETISEDKFSGEFFNSKEFDEISISQALLNEQLLKEIDIPTMLDPSVIDSISEDDKLFTEMSMIEGFSTIMVLDDVQENEDEDDIDLQLENGSVMDKIKKKKRIRNKQPKEKKVSNNPFDKLR